MRNIFDNLLIDNPFMMMADSLRRINRSLTTRAHLRPALGLHFDFTTRYYFIAEISLIFWTARLELWTWEA